MNGDTDRGGPLWGWLELLRLPNIFTAVADVTMGFLVVQVAAEGQRTWQIQPAEAATLLLLAAASSLLYAAGVVLNDVFDLDTDRRERPERPIPSGRVPLRAARRAGWLLLLAGVALAWIVTFHEGRSATHPPPAPDNEDLEVIDDGHTAGNSAPIPWVERLRPGLIGVLLAAAIVLYDLGLKRTPLGPMGMGACRMLNVLLGMSVLVGPFRPEHFLIAGGIGVYVAGITWLARNETGRCDRRQILAATSVMAVGIALLAWLPRWLPPGNPSQVDPSSWCLFMVLLGAMILWRSVFAATEPAPRHVRTAVTQTILSIIMLDAAVCSAVRGPWPWAAVLLALLVPAMFLGRWLEST
jgi:4-hydroxybenzoate polyprenyltransferase